jgi:hypothetical protein
MRGADVSESRGQVNCYTYSAGVGMLEMLS